MLGGEGASVDYELETVPVRHRLSNALDKLERAYLKVLRAAILILATLLIAGAIILAAVSLYKMSRSTSSVVEEQASVAASEIVDAEQPRDNPSGGARTPQVNVAVRNYYDGFVRRYHRLFRERFEPFRQRDDKQLSLTEFGDNYIQPTERVKAVADGDLNFEDDKRDLESLLTVMTAAAGHSTTQQRLKKYMNARKVRVCRAVQRTRTVTQEGWDRYSMNCSQWYDPPVGCPVTRSIQQPYESQECSMEFPPNTQTHSEIFRAFQDKYLSLLQSRREANAATAADERAQILAGKITGAASLFTTLQILGAFLVLMFFFLLIAIERHLRKRSVAA